MGGHYIKHMGEKSNRMFVRGRVGDYGNLTIQEVTCVCQAASFWVFGLLQGCERCGAVECDASLVEAVYTWEYCLPKNLGVEIKEKCIS